MKLIGLIGGAGAGKSTAAAHLVKEHGFVELTMAGPLKDLCARFFGWDRSRLDELAYKEEQDPKLPEGWTRRRVLQFVGTECFRTIDSNVWAKQVLRTMDEVWDSDEKMDTPIVISDVRFPNEVELIRANGGIVVRVERDDPDFESTTPAHASEDAINHVIPDYVIRAEFGVDRVQQATERMMRRLLHADAPE
jgi:hypothetical protein